MLSHTKYNQLASGFAECGVDSDAVERLLNVVKTVLNYSEEKKTYKRAYYDNLKAKREATGQTAWTEYRQKYYQEHKEEINKKRSELYHKKKAEQESKEA